MTESGEDLEGTRYERIQLSESFGYQDLILVYAPWAQFSDWDEEMLMQNMSNLIHSARARKEESK